MVLNFDKQISLNLKEELFLQTFDFREDNKEYGKLQRLLNELGWLQEYQRYEEERNDSIKRRLVQDGL